MNLIDMSMAYFLISSVIITVPSFIIFGMTSVNFSWYYFWQGIGGSLGSCIGATIADYALGKKDIAQGPIVALLNVRIVIVVVFDALVNLYMLSAMQWIGLILGIAGTLILSIPD